MSAQGEPVTPSRRGIPGRRRLLVLSAGGTISMGGPDGAKPRFGADALVAALGLEDLRIDTRTVLNVPSAHLSLEDQLMICREARDAARRGIGVVVTHGPDSLEVAAMLCDLRHAADAPGG
ncbi:MAG: asparaginase domain-containing protein, partial [Solirubrobacteraceae bacterium]